MKNLLTIISLLLIFQQSSAQNIDSLHHKMIGTWELSKYLSTNNGTGNESPDKIRRIKTLTKSSLGIDLYEVKSGKLISKVSGDYSLFTTQSGDSNYQEKVISSSPGIDSTQTKVLKKLVSIDEADRMIYTWTSNFITYTEIWLRIDEGNNSLKTD